MAIVVRAELRDARACGNILFDGVGRWRLLQALDDDNLTLT
jgi:hypothetical protein